MSVSRIPPLAGRARYSRKTDQFTESVIREMTRLALAHGAINLAQGFPNFPAPAEIKRAAQQAIEADINQYAIAARAAGAYGLAVDPEREVTVCCGATEAMAAAMMAIIDPGDEVIVFEPYYENYGPDAILSGATPRYVKLQPPAWTFDPDELAAAFSPATKAIIVNTPNNPTGKVLTREELETIRDLAVRYDAYVITDEIYEYIVYDGARHIPPATIDGLRERTIAINSLSKTYAVTGWRVGWCIAPPETMSAIRKVHDFLTVGAAAPLQQAGAVALAMPESYYRQLAADYTARRDLALAMLEGAGFRCFRPQGTYYVMTDISSFGFSSDVAFAKHLVENVGVAAVPGSSFYRNPQSGSRQIRFAFCKTTETLRAAAERLATLGSR
jgi:aspartate/methionine/tyrosine aminotransferase